METYVLSAIKTPVHTAYTWVHVTKVSLRPHLDDRRLLPVRPAPVGNHEVHLLQAALALDLDAANLVFPLVEEKFEPVAHHTGRAIAGEEGERGGGKYSFLVCLSHLIIDHASFRDGAPLLLLTETPSTFGRS